MTEPKAVSRVVMLWPASLKEEIQAEVGKRGLTAYVLGAVEQRRSSSDVGSLEVQRLRKEVAELQEQVEKDRKIIMAMSDQITNLKFKDFQAETVTAGSEVVQPGTDLAQAIEDLGPTPPEPSVGDPSMPEEEPCMSCGRTIGHDSNCWLAVADTPGNS